MCTPAILEVGHQLNLLGSVLDKLVKLRKATILVELNFVLLKISLRSKVMLTLANLRPVPEHFVNSLMNNLLLLTKFFFKSEINTAKQVG